MGLIEPAVIEPAVIQPATTHLPRKKIIMNTNIARLFSTLIVPVVLVAGAVGCHQESKANGAAVALASELDRDAPLVPKNHPELAFYSARTEGEEQTKVFLQGKADKAPRLVYVDPQPGELVRVSDDGTQGVYRRFISPGETVDIVVHFRKTES